ncbi:MAG: PAS domain S-box protein [Planctomyces sp.]|nr:PAS domain S-box protein [Planctomyces sp.]
MSDNLQFDTTSESEYRYQSLRSAVADYHYHVEVEGGRIRRKSHGANCVSVTGYTAEEYSADPLLWMAIVVEEDRHAIEQQISEITVGGTPRAIEYRIRRKDGCIRWIQKIVVPYHDGGGRLFAYDALLRDVTDRRRVEDELRQSEERFRLIFEDDLTGDYLARPDGEILLCNHAFANIFGFGSAKAAIGSNLANLYGDPAAWPGFIRLLTENGTLERHERAGRQSDGTIRHVIESVIGSFNAQGELIRIKGYVYDDTDSRMTEARLRQRNAELEEVVTGRTHALREKHEHLKAVWNSAFDAIITIDSQGFIETANRAAEKMFGYSTAELTGQNVRILMPSPYFEEHDGYLQQFRETGKTRILNRPRELVARRKDGSTFPIDLSVTQVDHSGYFTGIIRDCSERKELQRHILEIAADEQRRIGIELHDGVGQELTGLSLVAGTLLNLVEAIPAIESEGPIVREIEEVRFRRIWDIARTLDRKLSEANRHVQHLSHGIMPVQIDAEALRSALAELAASTNTPPRINCEFVCRMPVIAANNTAATHLYRIAQEAVNNALRHSNADRILITLRQDQDQIILEVSDNGIGIETLTNDAAGTRKSQGMGLKTMRYRAGLIGGTLHIEGRDGGGTLIRCTSLFRRNHLP